MLKFDLDKCVGCRVCETVCSSYHLKEFAPNRARLFVNMKNEFEFSIDYCHHCDNAPCINACPYDAIYHKNDILYIDQEKCIMCGKCVEACPYNAIQIDKKLETAIKCDLCDGEVWCVKYCPQNVIKYDN